MFRCRESRRKTLIPLLLWKPSRKEAEVSQAGTMIYRKLNGRNGLGIARGTGYFGINDKKKTSRLISCWWQVF